MAKNAVATASKAPKQTIAAMVHLVKAQTSDRIRKTMRGQTYDNSAWKVWPVTQIGMVVGTALTDKYLSKLPTNKLTFLISTSFHTNRYGPDKEVTYFKHSSSLSLILVNPLNSSRINPIAKRLSCSGSSTPYRPLMTLSGLNSASLVPPISSADRGRLEVAAHVAQFFVDALVSGGRRTVHSGAAVASETEMVGTLGRRRKRPDVGGRQRSARSRSASAPRVDVRR